MSQRVADCVCNVTLTLHLLLLLLLLLLSSLHSAHADDVAQAVVAS